MVWSSVLLLSKMIWDVVGGGITWMFFVLTQTTHPHHKNKDKKVVD
jgi:hypothetical protein